MGSVYFLLVMTGLHRMNAQHVRRQLRYAEIVAGNRKDRVQKPIVAPTPKPAGTNPALAGCVTAPFALWPGAYKRPKRPDYIRLFTNKLTQNPRPRPQEKSEI